jgi:hypothetical protein
MAPSYVYSKTQNLLRHFLLMMKMKGLFGREMVQEFERFSDTLKIECQEEKAVFGGNLREMA